MTTKERTEVIATVKGLLAIAKIAMPDTYFLTDRRVTRAHKLVLTYKRVNKRYS